MYRERLDDANPREVVHHPAPRAVVYGTMVFIALISLPGIALDPEAPRTGTLVALGVWLLFEAGLLSIALRRVVLRRHDRTGMLELVSTRWPLAARTHQVALERVRDVAIEKAPRSAAFRLALVLDGGEQLPVTNSYFGRSSRMERDAAAIRELCA